MKYKVGDKVRVRKDLELDKKYGDVLYSLDMDEFKNKECVITKVGFIAYKINNSVHWWSEEMLEPVDDLLEYALKKLGMTKEKLKNEMDRDKEDEEKAKEMVRLNHEMTAYCDAFKWKCQGCKVKEFKDKYNKFGKMICSDVFKYLKDKGEI